MRGSEAVPQFGGHFVAFAADVRPDPGGHFLRTEFSHSLKGGHEHSVRQADPAGMRSCDHTGGRVREQHGHAVGRQHREPKAALSGGEGIGRRIQFRM